MSSLSLEGQRVGLELHALLQAVDPARWRQEASVVAQARMDTIRAHLSGLTLSGADGLHGRLAELRHLVEPAGTDIGGDAKAYWQAFRSRAEPVYGSLCEALVAHDIHLPKLRPTNYLRNLQHFLGAVLVVGLIQHVLPTQAWRIGIAGGAFGFAVFLEVGRRLSPPFNAFLMSILGRIAHPHETHRVNSASWFILALFTLSFFDLVYGTVGVAILGAADPAAAVIGRRFGRRELVNGRTVEGTLTFWLVGAGVSATALALWFDYPTVQLLVMAAAASGFAAVAELFARRLDDNLVIPVCAAAGLWLAMSLF